MDKLKAIYDKNKKIIIPLAIVLVLLVAVGIYFVSQSNDDTNKKAEKETEEKVDSSKEDKKEDKDKGSTGKSANKNDTSDDKLVSDEKAGQPTNNSENTTSSSSSNGNSNTNVSPVERPASKPSQPTKPTHSHVWKDHIATKRVWVPNIVDVPVYETKKVYGAQFYTFSGYNELGQETWIANGPIYWFENGFTHDDLNEIIYNALLQSPNGVVDGVLYANYANIQRYDKVQTGTTQEDQGSYKNENYVDFQYCDCGAIK